MQSLGNAISLESILRQSLKFTMNASVMCCVRHISHYQIKCILSNSLQNLKSYI